MKRFILLIAITLLYVVGIAQDKTLNIAKDATFGDRSFSASDTINESDSYWVLVNCNQDFPQMQDLYVTLDSISGSPNVTVTLQGKKFTNSSWVTIGTPVVWYGSSEDTTIVYSNATANRYRFYKVLFETTATDQQSKITDMEFKTWFTGGTLSVTSVTDGTMSSTNGALTGVTTIAASGRFTGTGGVTITGAVSNINASSNFATNIGTGSTTSAVTIGGGSNDVVINSDTKIVNDKLLTLGTTTTNAETKITAEFDETTTGIGLFRIGDLSNPQVLNTNPGASVAADIVNINHSAGNGDCTDLLGRYTKINMIGSGDAGVTIAVDAPRAYVGLTGGANNSVVAEAYASQPWFRHQGTGAITAGSGLSAKCDVGADNFTASTINAAHLHIDGAATVTGQFDGMMVEVYPTVTSLDNAIKVAVDAGATVQTGLTLSGTFASSDIEVSSGAKIFTGSAANGNAVYAEVGDKDATGSIYISTAGALYIQVANAGAESDWYKVTATNAD